METKDPKKNTEKKTVFRKTVAVAVAGVVTLILGIFIASLLTDIGGKDQGGLVPYSKVKKYEAKLSKLTKDKDQASERLDKVRSEVEKLEKQKEDAGVYIKKLEEENQKDELTAGIIDVKGPGLVITIQDPVKTEDLTGDVSTITYNFELLLSLVNKLKEAGGEAISINGQRIVQTTEISLAGDNVNINGKATAEPYTVKVIGDSENIRNAITIRSGIIDNMRKNYKLRVAIRASDNIIIDKYDGNIDFDYAKPVKNNGK